MRQSSSDFAYDPCDPVKRNKMVHAARNLLSSVTRLLCVADMADVYNLLTTLSVVEKQLSEVYNVQTKEELLLAFDSYRKDVTNLANLTRLRQADLKDYQSKDELAAACVSLKKCNQMLLTTSKTCITHPEISYAISNKNFVMKEINSAFRIISNTVQADKTIRSSDKLTGLLANLNQLKMSVVNATFQSNIEKDLTNECNKLLNTIVYESTCLAESKYTRENTKSAIFSECRKMKEEMIKFNSVVINDKINGRDELKEAKSSMQKIVKNLTKLLQRSAAEHVSVAFLDVETPLHLLVKSAQSGNCERVEKYVDIFLQCARRLEEVSAIACSMSVNAEGSKMVSTAAAQTSFLCPEVVNAARTLALFPESRVANENMEVFWNNWNIQVKLLTDAVDDITSVDDVLFVSELCISEGITQCIESAQRNDAITLDVTSNLIHMQMIRLCHIIQMEMDNYEPGPFTDAVSKSLHFLMENTVLRFDEQIKLTVSSLLSFLPFNKNDFIDAARMVHDGLSDIRNLVLMRNVDTETESESEYKSEENLFEKIVYEQDKQREIKAYEQLKAGGKVYFQIHSEAENEAGVCGLSSIIVNGVEYCPCKPGYNVVVLNEMGVVVSSKSYDTTSHFAGVTLAKDLESLPENHIVLIAVQGSTGNGIMAASNVLKSLGAVEPIKLGPHDTWAFAGYKGDYKIKSWVAQSSVPSHKGPAVISSLINSPAAEIAVNKESKYCENSSYTSSQNLVENVFNSEENSEMAPKVQNSRLLLSELPLEERTKIIRLSETLDTERNRLVTEINKWDSQDNKIISLSNDMCIIMLDLSDFTRGTGPFKTMKDIVRAAELIAYYGSQINKLASEIALMCPHSLTKNDLVAYLQRVTLYSHQLTMTARSKADCQVIGGEPIITGVENVASLIQAARNLMNSVILTVKASYIASTRHKQTNKVEVVSWRMRSPEKKSPFRLD